MIDRDSIQPGGGSDDSEYSAESGLMLVFGEELFLAKSLCGILLIIAGQSSAILLLVISPLSFLACNNDDHSSLYVRNVQKKRIGEHDLGLR